MNPKQNSTAKGLNKKEDFTLSSNPIRSSKRYASEPKKTANKLYCSVGTKDFLNSTVENIDAVDFLTTFCECARKNSSLDEFFCCLNSTISDRLGFNFIALGLIKHSVNSLNLKVIDRINNTYSIKILMSDDQNPIVNCLNSNNCKVLENVDFLNIHHIKNTSTIMLPLIANGECIGILMAGGNNISPQRAQILKLVSEFSSLYIQNLNLNNMASQNADKDVLTGLLNHRGFQDQLREVTQKAKELSQSASVIIFDIHNIAKINRELGHARGDEVIKLVANKIEENIRPGDIAARYGGDEMAVILPNSDNSEATYMAEYINYIISCSTIDDIGSIKMSIGIASYPNCANNQEKLLLLAEQAVTISKHKSYKNGLSTIISAQDINFWDGTALKSFASVISKRHSELGINFEDELLNKLQNEKIESNTHLIEMVTSLAGAIDAKDPYTNGHSQSVSRYAEALAVAINMPEKEVERIKLGGLLHDVGKIGVPESILKKPEKLTDDEWHIMQQHPSIGVRKVLGPIESLKDLIPIVEHHHENWDGTGYPAKLAGENIPIGARIVAVADAYHALISDRPYRKGLGVDKAIEILKAGAGIQWDKNLVRKFILIAPSLSTTI